MSEAFYLHRTVGAKELVLWENGNGLTAFNGLFQRTAGLASTSSLASGNVNVYLPTDDQSGSVLGSRSSYDMTGDRYEKLVIEAKRTGYGRGGMVIADNPYGNNYYSGFTWESGTDGEIVEREISIPGTVNSFYICFYGSGERSVEIRSIRLAR